MVEVSGDENVARFAAEPIAHPRRRIVRLQITCRGKFRERVARAPEHLRRLPRAKLAAVPHDRRPRAPVRCLCRPSLRLRLAAHRQRPTRIDLWTDRLGVVDEKQFHAYGFAACG